AGGRKRSERQPDQGARREVGRQGLVPGVRRQSWPRLQLAAGGRGQERQPGLGGGDPPGESRSQVHHADRALGRPRLEAGGRAESWRGGWVASGRRLGALKRILGGGNRRPKDAYRTLLLKPTAGSAI